MDGVEIKSPNQTLETTPAGIFGSASRSAPSARCGSAFRLDAFGTMDGGEDYAKHLDEAAEHAVQMKRAFQRF
jgi:hypothetical protein